MQKLLEGQTRTLRAAVGNITGAEGDARLKPCPFCGEALVKKSDHHGNWYGHRDEVGECWASIAQTTTRWMRVTDL